MDNDVLKGERVKQLRDIKRWSQFELVEAIRKAGGSASQAQVTAMENSKVKRPKCLPELAAVLGTSINYLLGRTDDPTPLSDSAPSSVTPPEVVAPAVTTDLPIWLTSEGAGGMWSIRRLPIAETSRPPQVIGVADAFACYAVTDMMNPAIRRRDLLICDPTKPVAAGDIVLFSRHDIGDQPTEVMVRHLAHISPAFWEVEQFTPKRSVKLSRAEWTKAILVVGNYYRT